jgi:phosphoserine aminotransferase
MKPVQVSVFRWNRSITERKKSNALIVVDAVSSLPYPDFDFTKLDSVFFSVQKGFGLPAGLGVWIVNEKCIAKAEHLLSKGISIGSYHSIPGLKATRRQTSDSGNAKCAWHLLAG